MSGLVIVLEGLSPSQQYVKYGSWFLTSTFRRGPCNPNPSPQTKILQLNPPQNEKTPKYLLLKVSKNFHAKNLRATTLGIIRNISSVEWIRMLDECLH